MHALQYLFVSADVRNQNSYMYNSLSTVFFFFFFFFFLSAVILGCFWGCLSSGCQTVWIQIRPRVVWGLIWVQIVYKDYQQTSLVHLHLHGYTPPSVKGLSVCLKSEPYYSSTIFLQISYSI